MLEFKIIQDVIDARIFSGTYCQINDACPYAFMWHWRYFTINEHLEQTHRQLRQYNDWFFNDYPK